MCTNCGCAVTPGEIHIHSYEGSHSHPHAHSHSEPHSHSEHRTLDIHEAILAKNERFAERNRGYFMAKNLLVLNVLSSPGSGKTALLERTLSEFGKQHLAAVIVGDLETDNDAQRIRRSGAQAIQITTGNVCHLEAEMVAKAVNQLNLNSLQLLIIENVGNLVCPAAYDLGETLKVAVLSVTEGEDKPLKYPGMFKLADIILINKIDLAEAVEFNREIALKNLQQIAPQAKIFEVSAKTGEGMEQWYHDLEHHLKIHHHHEYSA